jgi:hypothetical protein
MNATKKKPEKPSVDIDVPVVEGAAVTLDEPAAVRDASIVSVSLRRYRPKCIVLLVNTLKLKNAVVAYCGTTPVRIGKCIDYFYACKDDDTGLAKSIAAAMGSGCACAVLCDENKDFHVCSLDSAPALAEISNNLDPALPSSKETTLETLGIECVGNCAIRAIVTVDGAVLAAIPDDPPFIEGNAHYQVVPCPADKQDLVGLVKAMKSRPLEAT